MELDFERIYKLSVNLLKFNRFYPFYKIDMKWIVQVLFLYSISLLIFLALMQSSVYYIKINELSDVCDNGVFSLAFLGLTFMYGTVIWHKNDLIYLIESVQKDYDESKDLSQTEINFILDYIEKGKRVVHLWAFVSIFNVFFIPSRILVVMVSEGKYNLVDVLDSFHPNILEKSTSDIWIFFLELLIRLYYSIYANIMYVGFSPLGPIFMAHACGQLEIVMTRIKSIFTERNYDEREAKIKLIDVVQRMQRIYRFVDSINNTCELYYQITLNSTSLMLPLIVYMVIKDFQMDKVFQYITFIFGSFLMTFIPCSYSTLLLAKGDEMRESIYMSGWERHLDRDARATIIIVLTRASRPISIHTLFKTINLDAFTDVNIDFFINQSATIFIPDHRPLATPS
uniref:Odorant receptor n=1 Tax=Histia rhodope TaxID=1453155 RepID=A0A7G4KBV9_9NEOP|nr:odorant receptor [Histia rhodope]